jgi:hypothetical protein
MYTYIFYAVTNTQIKCMATYCTIYAISKLRHVSTNICSHLQGAHTKITFR